MNANRIKESSTTQSDRRELRDKERKELSKYSYSKEKCVKKSRCLQLQIDI